MIIDVNGVTLFFKVEGEGEPLLLLHGNGEDHSIFTELMEKLKQHFTVYAIDSRNHGQSTLTGDFSYDTMAEDMKAFIDCLSLGKVNIVGFSDGAIISLILGMKHQECIKKMVLLGVNLKPDDFTEESYQFVKGTYEKTQDPLFKLMLEQPQIEIDEIRGVDIPTLVVGGEQDIYKPDTFENIAGALPDAQLMMMPGHSHDSYVVHQDILYKDLLNFFN